MKGEILSLEAADKIAKYDKTIQFLEKKIKRLEEIEDFFGNSNAQLILMPYKQILYYLKNGHDVLEDFK